MRGLVTVADSGSFFIRHACCHHMYYVNNMTSLHVSCSLPLQTNNIELRHMKGLVCQNTSVMARAEVVI